MRRLGGSLSISLVAATTLVTARAAAPAQDPAAALLAKHRAYVGWQFGDGTFTTMRLAGSVTNENGEKTDKLVTLSVGVVYHTTDTMLRRDNVTEHTGFTGNLFWRSGINGFTTPIYGDYAKYLASFTVLQQEGTTELPATFVGDKKVDGKSVGVVRVTLSYGDPIDCDVDPQTGAYVAATIESGRFIRDDRSYRCLPRRSSRQEDDLGVSARQRQTAGCIRDLRAERAGQRGRTSSACSQSLVDLLGSAVRCRSP